MQGWKKAEYPGDSVLQQDFLKDNEFGDVRIMDYGEGMVTRYRVAMFCPGSVVFLPGDTPKTEPEADIWSNDEQEAQSLFELFVDCAKEDGWLTKQ